MTRCQAPAARIVLALALPAAARQRIDKGAQKGALFDSYGRTAYSAACAGT